MIKFHTCIKFKASCYRRGGKGEEFHHKLLFLSSVTNGEVKGGSIISREKIGGEGKIVILFIPCVQQEVYQPISHFLSEFD